MSEEDSDNFSVDSLENADIRQGASSSVHEAENIDDVGEIILPQYVHENSIVYLPTTVDSRDPRELPTVHTLHRKNVSNIQVPFYTGDVPLTEIQKMQRSQNNLMTNKIDSNLNTLPNHRSKFTHKNKSNPILPSWPRPNYEGDEARTNIIKTASEIRSDDIQFRTTPKNNSFPKKYLSSCGTSTSLGSTRQPAIPYNYKEGSQDGPASTNVAMKQRGKSYLQEYLRQKGRQVCSKVVKSEDAEDLDITRTGFFCDNYGPSSTTPKHYTAEEAAFYKQIINGELETDDLSLKLNVESTECDGTAPSSAATSTRSKEETGRVPQMINGIRNHLDNCGKKNTYSPYKYHDYRLPILPSKMGMLGPDLEANKEKMERLRRQREYGTMASLKNLENFRLKSIKIQMSDEISQSTDTITASTGDDARVRSSCKSPSMVKPIIKKPVRCMTNPLHLVPLALHDQQKQRKSTSNALKIVAGNDDKFKSNKEVIKKMQERHQNEVCVVESIRRNCRQE